MNINTIFLLEQVIKKTNSSLENLNYRKQELTQDLEFTISSISQAENEVADYLNAIKCLKQ